MMADALKKYQYISIKFFEDLFRTIPVKQLAQEVASLKQQYLDPKTKQCLLQEAALVLLVAAEHNLSIAEYSYETKEEPPAATTPSKIYAISEISEALMNQIISIQGIVINATTGTYKKHNEIKVYTNLLLADHKTPEAEIKLVMWNKRKEDLPVKRLNNCKIHNVRVGKYRGDLNLKSVSNPPTTFEILEKPPDKVKL